ncbi:MAG: permease prefix domain 1-containing protein [Acidobacteriota bacterium]
MKVAKDETAWARLTSLFRKRVLDGELEAELESHIELATEDNVRRGLPPAEARRMARVKLGAIEASKDLHRDARGLPWLEGIAYDLRFAIRGLRRDRGFTLTAVVMLALAIGLNVTVFAVMNTMLFRGFPLVRGNDRLVYIQEKDARGCCIAYPDFEDWRAQAKSFEDMAFVSARRLP